VLLGMYFFETGTSFGKQGEQRLLFGGIVELLWPT
jgi:hypothetical protein